MAINPVQSFATSKTGQRFYKWLCDPKKERFFNCTLLNIDTAVATASYIASTEMQPNIPREQKNLLNWQNVLSAVVGITCGAFFNRKASRLVDKVIPKISKNIEDVHKVKTGLAICLPLVVTSATMRFAIPVITAQVSAIIEERRRKASLNKLA